MEHLKVKVNGEFDGQEGLLYEDSLVERNGRYFAVVKELDNVDKEGSKYPIIAIEFVKDGDWSLAVPTVLYTDEDDVIIETQEIDSYIDMYYRGESELIVDFLDTFGEVLELEKSTSIAFVKELIEEDCYYYCDGNEFSLEVEDFKIEGKLAEGMYYGNVMIVDLALKHDEIGTIAELPSVQYDGILDPSEEDDIEYVFANLLSSTRKEDMKSYILKSISQ